MPALKKNLNVVQRLIFQPIHYPKSPLGRGRGGFTPNKHTHTKQKSQYHKASKNQSDANILPTKIQYQHQPIQAIFKIQFRADNKQLLLLKILTTIISQKSLPTKAQHIQKKMQQIKKFLFWILFVSLKRGTSRPIKPLNTIKNKRKIFNK